MGAVLPSPPSVNSSHNQRSLKRSKRDPNVHIHPNAWILVDSEFDMSNSLFSFTLEACYDPYRLDKHGLLHLYYEKLYILTRDIAGQSVYCNPPWFLGVQYVEHIRNCHAKSPKNT